VSARVSEDLGFIVYTSVEDALVNATYATPALIKKAIAHERRHGKRSALITGLERELRRRSKPKAAR
jgi:hypothetical protein